MNDEIVLDEPIQVVARFDTRGVPCQVVKFRRRSGQEVVVSELGLRYPVARGQRTVHVFDVMGGGSDWRLEFDSLRLGWRLTRQADRYD